MIESLGKPNVLGAVATCAAALMGFGGVIMTLLVNARNTRRAERARSAHETEVLRRALLAEVTILRDTFKGEICFIEHGNKFTYVPAVKADTVYNGSIQRLGLLEPAAVVALVRAYSTFQERVGYIMARGRVECPGGAVLVDLTDERRVSDIKSDLHEIVRCASEAVVSLNE